MTAIAPGSTAADYISLNKNDIVPILGKGQSGRHAGKAATNNRDFAIKITGGCRKFWLVGDLNCIDGIKVCHGLEILVHYQAMLDGYFASDLLRFSNNDSSLLSRIDASAVNDLIMILMKMAEIFRGVQFAGQ